MALLYSTQFGAMPREESFIKLLVESYKTTDPSYEFDWSIMLQTLIDNCAPVQHMQVLISTQRDFFPEQQLNLVDVIMVMAKYTADFTRRTSNYWMKIYLSLVRVTVSGRLEVLNVRRWRDELEENIDNLYWVEGMKYALSTETTKILAQLELCELLKEATSVLELAIWNCPSLIMSTRWQGLVMSL